MHMLTDFVTASVYFGVITAGGGGGGPGRFCMQADIERVKTGCSELQVQAVAAEPVMCSAGSILQVLHPLTYYNSMPYALIQSVSNKARLM